MSTTSLIIEFLITGIQVALWLTLLFLAIFGINWINFERLKGAELIISALALPVVYPVGIFVDNLADRLLDKWNWIIRDKYLKEKSQSIIKLLLLTKDERLGNIFEYSRTRIRISRSTALNFAVIAIALPLFIITRLDNPFGMNKWRVAALGSGTCLLITIFALWSWQHITHTVWSRLKYTFELYPENTVIDPILKLDEKIPLSTPQNRVETSAK